MSATADKARYFLEQSVPELRELERKKLFSHEEITAIARKRSDHEHKVNARGSLPSDYAQYAEFEINVDQLRRKRIKRLGVKATMHSGQRRIFFVFDRGNRKFSGDLKLWMQGIHYARSQKALKKVTQLLTNALRLHPTKPGLWIYAAQFALEENGDMTEARGYMQRALRFCKTSQEIWVQNFRLELTWIAKLHARRRILGIEKEAMKQEQIKVAGTDDKMMLPTVTAEDIMPLDGQRDEIDVGAIENLENTPVMTAGIPMAIFDAAMDQFSGDLDLAMRFFSESRQYIDMLPTTNLLSHICSALQTIDANAWQSHAASIAVISVSVSPEDYQFPSAMRATFAAITEGLSRTKQRYDLLTWCQGYLKDLASGPLDPALVAVLTAKSQSLS